VSNRRDIEVLGLIILMYSLGLVVDLSMGAGLWFQWFLFAQVYILSGVFLRITAKINIWFWLITVVLVTGIDILTVFLFN